MPTIKQVSIGLAVVATVQFVVPRDIEIPRDYWISEYAQRVLADIHSFIDVAQTEPDGKLDIGRHLRKIESDLANLIKYVVIEPLIAIAYLIEKLVRYYFLSANQMTQQNIENLKKINSEFALGLEKARRYVDELIKVGDSTVQDCRTLATQIEEHNDRLEQTTGLIQNKTAALETAKKSTNPEAFIVLLKKQSTEILDNLKNPPTLKQLKTYLQIHAAIEKTHQAAIQKIQDLTPKYKNDVEGTETLQKKQSEPNAKIIADSPALLKATANIEELKTAEVLPPSAQDLFVSSKIWSFNPIEKILSLMPVVN